MASDELEQRVVLRARATPAAPARVNLFVDGVDVIPKVFLGRRQSSESSESSGSGGPSQGSALLSLRGPFSGAIPFGAFDVLYLDASLRVVRTSPQGFLAINVRDEIGD